eukprot:g16220.t1
MAYVRGHAEDYERWARELNTDFWSYDNVLPYYKRLQKHQGEESAYRGKEGVYKVCQKASEETRELNTAFVEAGAVKSGYGKTKDQNGLLLSVSWALWVEGAPGALLTGVAPLVLIGIVVAETPSRLLVVLV